MTQRWLTIEGMTCDHCRQSVAAALAGVPGVESAEVELASRRAIVRLSDTRPPQLAELEAAVRAAGYVLSNAESPEPGEAEDFGHRGAASPAGETSQASGEPKPARAPPLDVVTLELPLPPQEARGPAPEPQAAEPHAAEAPARRLLLEVDGMHCASCVGRVESALQAVGGVRSAQANLALLQAEVQYDADQVRPAQLVEALARQGYTARVTVTGRPSELTRRQAEDATAWRRRLTVGLVLLVPLIMVDAFTSLSAGTRHWAQFLWATPIQVYLGWPFWVAAWHRLRAGGASMDTLVTLGTGAAYLAGVAGLVSGHGGMVFLDGAMILTFVTLGRYLEALAKGRASQAILGLLELAPPEAVLLRDGQPVSVPVEQVSVGDRMLVRPGARIGLDGRIVAGFGGIDESWLTGEALPAEKSPGDEVFAGTLNGNGALTVEVLRPAGQTALAQIARLVEEAQQSKAQVQRVADRVTGLFVPAVLVLAALALLGWGLWGGDWSLAVSSMVAVMVVACPCALGLATPMAVLVASGRAARGGILIKNAQALETAGRLSTVVLDKTGTVTEGRPQVTCMLPAEGVTAAELLAAAAAAEQLSQHPLARAVLTAARKQKVEVQPATELKVLPGLGIEARHPQGTLRVGHEGLLAAAGLDAGPWLAHLESLRRDGETPLFVARDQRVLGIVAVADVISSESGEAIEQLRQMGLAVHLLTGDRTLTARAVAARVGIEPERVMAEVLPEGKAAAVRQLRESGQTVAMVGDGINDAAALAEAQLGIALGTGADVAIEAADVVLAGRDLGGVVRTVRLARATLAVIHQNLVWAFLYNLVLLPVAAGALVPLWGEKAHLPPVAAAAAMAASSVSVVLNSLRLRRVRL